MTRTALHIRVPLFAGSLLLATSALFAQTPMPAAPVPEAAIEGKQESEAPPLDPTKEWPCVQRRVDTLSVGKFWDGPPIDELKGWYREPKMPDLIELLSSRRVPLEKAEAAIKAYAESLPEAERDAKLSLLFAGLFDKVSSQRRSVMSGIVKYKQSQIARAKELERQTTTIGEMESKLPPGIHDDTPELAKVREQFNWAQRIFQERQSNIPLACELPVLIEERLYAVTRSIRNNMKS
jgi:hypothetical protein